MFQLEDFYEQFVSIAHKYPGKFREMSQESDDTLVSTGDDISTKYPNGTKLLWILEHINRIS